MSRYLSLTYRPYCLSQSYILLYSFTHILWVHWVGCHSYGIHALPLSLFPICQNPTIPQVILNNSIYMKPPVGNTFFLVFTSTVFVECFMPFNILYVVYKCLLSCLFPSNSLKIRIIMLALIYFLTRL